MARAWIGTQRVQLFMEVTGRPVKAYSTHILMREPLLHSFHSACVETPADCPTKGMSVPGTLPIFWPVLPFVQPFPPFLFLLNPESRLQVQQTSPKPPITSNSQPNVKQE